MDTDSSTPSTNSTGTSASESPGNSLPGHATSIAAKHSIHATHCDHESDSDASMSAETDDEEDEVANTSTMHMDVAGSTLEHRKSLVILEPLPNGLASKKRKLSSSEDGLNGHISPHTENGGKRHKSGFSYQVYRNPDGKLRQDKSLLPAELWHHVFSFVPPRNLGILLLCCKSFSAYLDPSKQAHSITPPSRSVLQPLSPDAIWKASRVLYRPGMPSPLKDRSELDMWKLACNPFCQFCGKVRSLITDFQDQWHAGPGVDGVVPVWSFGVRTCGSCLQGNSVKEVTLLLSHEFSSTLLAALPYVFFSDQLHIIPYATLQNSQSPLSFKVAKTYFRPHTEDINQEFTNVKAMGPATAEEYAKGLNGRGKEAKADSARWERWEAIGGVARMRLPESAEVTDAPVKANGTIQPGFFPATNFAQGPPGTNGHTAANFAQRPAMMQTQFPHALQTSFPLSASPRLDSPAQHNGHAWKPPGISPVPRQEKTKEQIAELKAARRAEIERRCMQLSPPLTSAILAHMGSFQAAIQIIQPLTDGAWEVLKPRLLSQREDALQRLAQSRVLQDQINNLQQGHQSMLNGDLGDQWDELQAPLRARIGGYADETIRDGWGAGQKVSKDNCSVFAAQVLVYVRKRFYAELAKDEAAARATGREPVMDPTNGPYTRKLTLDNMKWVFETKIKPHTDVYRKELFLCSECEGNKLYGFEGVIQHYAAKHTTALSLGSVVVHWKAEWPENTPFNPEPPTGKSTASYHATAVPITGPFPVAAPPRNYGYGAYQQAPVSAPMQVPIVPYYQTNSMPYYGNHQTGEHYSAQQNTTYAAPQPYPGASYQAPHYDGPVNNVAYNEQPQDYSQQRFPPTTQAYYPPPTQVVAASPVAPVPLTQSLYPPQAGLFNHNPPTHGQQVVPVPAVVPPPRQAVPLLKTADYKAQLQDVARNAKDVWDSINGLKDIPGSAKVATIIYHVLKRSEFRFPEEPPLSMIIDGLTSNKDMRKIRNINGLLCKACGLESRGSTSTSKKKHYSFPQLVAHFNSVHEYGGSRGQNLNWTEDMIELPDFARLATAVKKGKSDSRIKLITDALPEILAPPPSPKMENDKVIGSVSTPSDDDQYDPCKPGDALPKNNAPTKTKRYRPTGNAATQKSRISDVVAQISQQATVISRGRPIEKSAAPKAKVSQGMRRRSVERSRSRSPKYVKTAPQYRERTAPPPREPVEEYEYTRISSPRGDYMLRRPINRPVEEASPSPVPAPVPVQYRERTGPPPREREPVEEYEYVRVNSPRGDYMLRRPIIRERERLREPVYVSYSEERERSFAARPPTVQRPLASPAEPEFEYTRISSPRGDYMLRRPIIRPVEEASAVPAPVYSQYRERTPPPPPREPIEEYEYVRVSSPRGDYMLRRPVVRVREREPVYTAYEEGERSYARESRQQQPVSRAPLPPRRQQSVRYEEEEYDPRHPEFPPAQVGRQVRYL